MGRGSRSASTSTNSRGASAKLYLARKGLAREFSKARRPSALSAASAERLLRPGGRCLGWNTDVFHCSTWWPSHSMHRTISSRATVDSHHHPILLVALASKASNVIPVATPKLTPTRPTTTAQQIWKKGRTHTSDDYSDLKICQHSGATDASYKLGLPSSPAQKLKLSRLELHTCKAILNRWIPVKTATQLHVETSEWMGGLALAFSI